VGKRTRSEEIYHRGRREEKSRSVVDCDGGIAASFERKVGGSRARRLALAYRRARDLSEKARDLGSDRGYRVVHSV
jgi:hypothetical protein